MIGRIVERLPPELRLALCFETCVVVSAPGIRIAIDLTRYGKDRTGKISGRGWTKATPEDSDLAATALS